MRKFRNIVMMFALILAVALTGCGDNSPNTPGTPVTGDLKIQSAAPVDEQTRQTMKQALHSLFAEAAAKNYTRYLSYANYTYVIREDCQPSPIDGIMSWKEYTPGYGDIWQAERVAIRDGASVQTVQICRDNLQNMANTTRYGAEHIILYFNDKPEFEKTKLHTEECACPHPIIR